MLQYNIAKVANLGLYLSTSNLIQAWVKLVSSLDQALIELGLSLIQAWLDLRCHDNSQYARSSKIANLG